MEPKTCRSPGTFRREHANSRTTGCRTARPLARASRSFFRRRSARSAGASAHAFGDRLDGAAFAGAVAALEDDAHLEALGLDPLLELDELNVQAFQYPLIFPFLERFAWRRSFRAGLRLDRVRGFRFALGL